MLPGLPFDDGQPVDVLHPCQFFDGQKACRAGLRVFVEKCLDDLLALLGERTVKLWFHLFDALLHLQSVLVVKGWLSVQ